MFNGLNVYRLLYKVQIMVCSNSLVPWSERPGVWGVCLSDFSDLAGPRSRFPVSPQPVAARAFCFSPSPFFVCGASATQIKAVPGLRAGRTLRLKTVTLSVRTDWQCRPSTLLNLRCDLLLYQSQFAGIRLRPLPLGRGISLTGEIRKTYNLRGRLLKNAKKNVSTEKAPPRPCSWLSLPFCNVRRAGRVAATAVQRPPQAERVMSCAR